MESVGDVVEISSDEEDFARIENLTSDALECFSDLFDEYVEGIGEGLDDLVVVSELSAPPVVQKKSKPVGGGGCGVADDDDCVVLDGDPDNVISVAEKGCGEDASDELQIVGEKGPLACRDFPHSRHLCASFPFSTTSHAKHCSMCHCFVCDSLAPCSYWGKGTLSSDHCNATDTDSKWKTLRQSFKKKSLPASHSEKHKNFTYSTMMPVSQQDTESQVSVLRPLPSLRSNIVRPSAGRPSLLTSMRQNQHMCPSIGVPQNVGRIISAPRASPLQRTGRGMADVTQLTQSHTRFKRVTPPGYTTSNANRLCSAILNNTPVHQALPCISQVAPRSNAFQNNAPQRSLSASIVPQANQGQPTLRVAPNTIHGTAPQLSRCTSLTTQRTQYLPKSPEDVCSKSWQDILASVASELGVSDYGINTMQAEQPVSASQPLHYGANQGVDPHGESVAGTTHLMSSDGHGLLNHTTTDNVQAYDPMIAAPTSCHLNCENSLAPNETHLNGFVIPPADGFGAAHQIEPSKLDFTDLLLDFELEGWG